MEKAEPNCARVTRKDLAKKSENKNNMSPNKQKNDDQNKVKIFNI